MSADLEAKMAAIISHATGGETSDTTLSLNDICVRITAMRNFIYEEGKKRADTTEAEEADLMVLGAHMLLENKVYAAEGCLQDPDWVPARQHIEGVLNAMRNVLEHLEEARVHLKTFREKAST